MSRARGMVRITFVLVALVGLLVSTTGCGYVKNVRDDVLDVGTFAVGIVPPVVGGEDGPQAVGFLPPCFGAYLEVTEFLHLGYLVKATGDLEWDRRGLGVMKDVRRKAGLGPWHTIGIEQTPIFADDYKTPGSPMEGWREHMRSMRDPIFNRPAKILIYGAGADEEVMDADELRWAEIRARIDGQTDVRQGLLDVPELPDLHRGWQDWETISFEIAIPEPFLLHSGFYLRAGFDPSQIFDMVLGLVGVDLYRDAAYECMSGDYKYLTAQQKAERARAAAEQKAAMEEAARIRREKHMAAVQKAKEERAAREAAEAEKKTWLDRFFGSDEEETAEEEAE